MCGPKNITKHNWMTLQPILSNISVFWPQLTFLQHLVSIIICNRAKMVSKEPFNYPGRDYIGLNKYWLTALWFQFTLQSVRPRSNFWKNLKEHFITGMNFFFSKLRQRIYQLPVRFISAFHPWHLIKCLYTLQH